MYVTVIRNIMRLIFIRNSCGWCCYISSWALMRLHEINRKNYHWLAHLTYLISNETFFSYSPCFWHVLFHVVFLCSEYFVAYYSAISVACIILANEIWVGVVGKMYGFRQNCGENIFASQAFRFSVLCI